MVLGRLRSRHKKGASVQVDFIIHVEEVKPWPPSQSYRSVQSMLLVWQNGDQNSGSFVSNVGETGIEFNESFALHVTLCHEKKSHDKFQKNFLNLYLYEHRKDKASRGQLLGTVTINLADFGSIEENLSICTPVNSKKISKGFEQPSLFITVQPVHKDISNLSPKLSLSKGSSIDKDEQVSVADSVNEGNDDQCEIASFTDDDDDDDDVSLPSSLDVTSSSLEAGKAPPPRHEKDGVESKTSMSSEGSTSNLGNPMNNHSDVHVGRVGGKNIDEKLETEQDEEIPRYDLHVGLQEFEERKMDRPESAVISNLNVGFGSRKDIKEKQETEQNEERIPIDDLYVNLQESQGRKLGHAESEFVNSMHTGLGTRKDTEKKLENEPEVERTPLDGLHVGVQESQERKMEMGHGDTSVVNDIHTDLVGGKDIKEKLETEQDKDAVPIDDVLASIQESQERKEGHDESEVVNSLHVSLVGGKDIKEKLETERDKEILVDAQNLSKNHVSEDANYSVNAEKCKPTNWLPDQTNEWKSRIEMLEEELREAAAVEVSLYSIIAEHGSSSNKVHAPARRLSRFYFNACKAKSQTKQENCARTAVSGLALVSKACGNDVPRLTFWLSNTIMLRAIVSQDAADTVDKNKPYIGSADAKTGDKVKNVAAEQTDWGDMEMFTLALEQVEAWIFSRIVESVWWQIFTPHMQRTIAKTSGSSVGSSPKKGNIHGFGDQEPGSFSIDLWKKAFSDACERLCPIRAEGHDCGCLPMLSKLVMEHLVSRLDVAMFNAILRESADEMPTDPVSDPISNPKVLPIPVGKLSLGAGVQLKNAVGNWSRWLSDLFEMETAELADNSNDMLVEDGQEESHKPFRLLNALSDLMMLPFEMLADPLTRKEVCPLFSQALIKIILSLFVPDEFSPKPVPQDVLEALDSEDDMDEAVESFTSFPCAATATIYTSPTAASVARFMGESGPHSLTPNVSSVLKKSYTSDDELDEVDSPLTSIIADRSRGCPTSTTNKNWTTKENGSRNLIRYQLLRDSWKDDDQ